MNYKKPYWMISVGKFVLVFVACGMIIFLVLSYKSNLIGGLKLKKLPQIQGWVCKF